MVGDRQRFNGGEDGLIDGVLETRPGGQALVVSLPRGHKLLFEAGPLS
jgi:hypothetical protein